VNLLIVFEEELQTDGTALLRGERARHACQVHQLSEGVKVSAALLGGLIGSAYVTRATPELVSLSLDLHTPPPARRGYTVVVGLSRPQTVKKVLSIAGMCGVDAIHFVKASQSQKSYLQSRVLEKERIQTEILKGLEQARDSIPARVTVHRNFKSFIEQERGDLEPHPDRPALRLLAHTQSSEQLTQSAVGLPQRAIIAIGPEAGWEAAEVESFKDLGFKPVGLGSRILRVEYALVSLISSIEVLCQVNSAK